MTMEDVQKYVLLLLLCPRLPMRSLVGRPVYAPSQVVSRSPRTPRLLAAKGPAQHLELNLCQARWPVPRLLPTAAS